MLFIVQCAEANRGVNFAAAVLVHLKISRSHTSHVQRTIPFGQHFLKNILSTTDHGQVRSDMAALVGVDPRALCYASYKIG